MDKRWIYIIIILIIGLSGLYYIVDTSTTVGSAIVGLNSFILSIPDSFNIEDTDHGYVSLANRQTNERIIIKDLGKSKSVDEIFEKELSAVVSSENVTIINNTTEKHNDITSKVVYYEKLPNHTFYKVMVFSKFNHTFLIKSINFKDVKSLNDITYFIIDNINLDHKKKQD